MKRIAYASPVNPAPSGISDYSEELLPFLGRYFDVTLYVEDGLRPANAQLARCLEVRPVGRLERDQRRRPYDAVLYHMGNSAAHMGIWRAMQRVPGVVVLHDFVLHHFMLQYYATALGAVERYRAEAERRYGADGARVAGLMMRGRFTEAAFDLPFCEDVLATAHGVIAHSRFVLERAAALRPELPAAHVPMGVPLPPSIPREEARARRGLPQDALLLASFGHINPYKRVESVLRALRELREAHPGARYILVGSVSPSYDVRAAVERAGLSDAVTVTGYVGRAAFEDYVAAADICVNLRHPTAGETSASLLRLLGAGRPTLVTATGSFAELPPGVAAQVDPDYAEGDLILAYCRLLADRPELAAAMGRAARDYVAREHTLEAAAAGYARFLAQLHGWEEPRPERGALWEIADCRLQITNYPMPSQTAAATTAPVPHPATHSALSAGANPPERRSAIFNLQSSIAAAAAELGTTEDDRFVLEPLAQAIRELDPIPFN
ncbi:MAG TPA: glycosyltransferase family 4 protein [Roseiflexaceae bacterium]|nr:glycosyltransferase family 4 protein [Roseiflexaceae bacterium]